MRRGLKWIWASRLLRNVLPVPIYFMFVVHESISHLLLIARPGLPAGRKQRSDLISGRFLQVLGTKYLQPTKWWARMCALQPGTFIVVYPLRLNWFAFALFLQFEISPPLEIWLYWSIKSLRLIMILWHLTLYHKRPHLSHIGSSYSSPNLNKRKMTF
jgi:hypothetical protein